MKKKTTEQFIKEAKIIHGNKYDYSKTVYNGIKTKVCIICPEHGEFWQLPTNHLKGKGCCKCGHERTNKSKILATEEFIKRAKEKHGDKYDYSKTKYTTHDSEIIVICPIHGEFKIIARRHLTGLGCIKCGRQKSHDAKRSNNSEFIKKSRKIHGDKYDYSKVNYITAVKKVEIICPKHGSFWMTPNKHLAGENCPKCAQSKGEYFIENILKILNLSYLPQYTISVNSELRTLFKIDFVIKLDKIYLIEYNGIQHYKPCDYFGGKEKFKEQQLRDQELRTFVQNNSNYQLLEIDYRYNHQIIINKILEFLNVPIDSNISSKLGELLENWKCQSAAKRWG